MGRYGKRRTNPPVTFGTSITRLGKCMEKGTGILANTIANALPSLFANGNAVGYVGPRPYRYPGSIRRNR